MRVTIELVRGKKRHVLDFGTRNGKRRRQYFDTIEEGEAALDAARKAESLAGRWWAVIHHEEKLEYIAVLKQMRDAKVHPADVWEAYQNGKIRGAVKERRTLREAIIETIQAKRDAGRKERY